MGKRRYKQNPAYSPRKRPHEKSVVMQNQILRLLTEILGGVKVKVHGYHTEANFAEMKVEAEALVAKKLEFFAKRGWGLSLADVAKGKNDFRLLWQANVRDFRLGGVFANQIKVPMSMLSQGQIEATPRAAFTDKEWAGLPKRTKDKVLSSEGTAEGIVADIEDQIEEMFSESRAETSDWQQAEAYEEQLYSWVGFGYLDMDTVNSFLGQFEDEDTAREVLTAWASNEGNWRADVRSWDYEEGQKVNPIPRSFEFSDHLVDLAEEATQAQFSEAFKRASEHYPENESLEDDITRALVLKTGAGNRYENLEPSHAVYFEFDWDEHESDMEEEVRSKDQAQFQSDGPVEPEEDRILYTFNDGAYVLRMVPEDLEECGEELGQCIKDAEHQYGTKIKSGEIDLYSLRTSSGRPKLTIEIHLDGRGKPVGIGDILGKGNRSVGWGSKKVKWMEVQKVGKILELLGFDPAKERSLTKAHSEMREHELKEARELTQNPRRRRRRR